MAAVGYMGLSGPVTAASRPNASQMNPDDIKRIREHLPQEIIDIAIQSKISCEVVYQTPERFLELTSPKVVFEVEKFGGVNVHIYPPDPYKSMGLIIPWKNGHCTHDAPQYHRGFDGLGPETIDKIYISCFRDHLNNIGDKSVTYLQFFERAIQLHVKK
ncbi:MAG TPA: hypothetical protein VLE89_08050 [Chlamydiales bacterium]|nr:hypothetical protein [Chlamydiales bacterium]